MSDATLESPASEEELYLAASRDEVDPSRPILTGDVFEDISIPGCERPGHALILTHPCSMRSDGVTLVDRVLMARVTDGPVIPLRRWSTGHFKIMPLPTLDGASHCARFDEMGLVTSAELDIERRLACLSPVGINLLQQRFIWYLTRFVAPTFQLNESCAGAFEEADLCEEWVSRTSASAPTIEVASTAFHVWIRATDHTGTSRQEQLREPQRRPAVRRAMRQHLRATSPT